MGWGLFTCSSTYPKYTHALIPTPRAYSSAALRRFFNGILLSLSTDQWPNTKNLGHFHFPWPQVKRCCTQCTIRLLHPSSFDADGKSGKMKACMSLSIYIFKFRNVRYGFGYALGTINVFSFCQLSTLKVSFHYFRSRQFWAAWRKGRKVASAKHMNVLH